MNVMSALKGYRVSTELSERDVVGHAVWPTALHDIATQQAAIVFIWGPVETEFRLQFTSYLLVPLRNAMLLISCGSTTCLRFRMRWWKYTVYQRATCNRYKVAIAVHIDGKVSVISSLHVNKYSCHRHVMSRTSVNIWLVVLMRPSRVDDKRFGVLMLKHTSSF